MKKFAYLFMAAVLFLGVQACGGSESGDEGTTTEEAVEETATEVETAVEEAAEEVEGAVEDAAEEVEGAVEEAAHGEGDGHDH